MYTFITFRRLVLKFLKKNLKWLATILVLTGILLTNLNIYPLNLFFDIENIAGKLSKISPSA